MITSYSLKTYFPNSFLFGSQLLAVKAFASLTSVSQIDSISEISSKVKSCYQLSIS